MKTDRSEGWAGETFGPSVDSFLGDGALFLHGLSHRLAQPVDYRPYNHDHIRLVAVVLWGSNDTVLCLVNLWLQLQ